jgi:hypothetical protein
VARPEDRHNEMRCGIMAHYDDAGAAGHVVAQQLDVLGEISVRFIDVANAQFERAIRAELIRLGWTPPPDGFVPGPRE